MSGGGGGRSRAPRAYRALLWLLPGRLRRRHGRAMEASFVEALERAGSGGPSRTRVWLGAVGDVLRRAVYERVRRPAGSSSLLRTLLPDVRFALRGFVRRPGMTLLAVVMLAVGVGSCTAVFGLTDALFLRPLPFPDAHRLMYLNETAPRWNLEYTAINHADHAVWRERNRTFEAMGLLGGSSYALADERGAERYDGLRVTYDLGPALGIRPALGRFFTPEEDSPGGPEVVMLGHDLWLDRFGGDPDVVGRTIRLNRVAHTIVGVLPPEADVVRRAQLWVPLARDPLDASQGYSFTGIGRVKPGVTVAEARADLERAHAPIWAERDTARIVSPVVMPLRERLAGDSRPVAIALGLAVGLVLLIACGNVASILLARSFARRRELGIRVALGASTGRIARQLFAESLALAVVAAPLGIVLGFGMIRGVVALLPDQPSWLDLSVDWRTGVFGLLLVLATTVIFGWAPVAQVGRQDARDALAEGGGRASAPRRQRRTMNLLVVAEITLAALLLVGGGLLFRTLQHLQQTDPGFRTENVIGFRVALPDAAYPDSAARDRLYAELVAGIEAIPGVRAAGVVSCPPLGGCHLGNFFHAIGLPGPGPDEQSPVVLTRFATTEYFRVMDIPLIHGRLFEPWHGRVAVINESFARQFFPGIENPVGREIERGSHPDPDEEGPFLEVIGVVRDVQHYGVDEPMRPGIYFDSHTVPRSSMSIMAWTAVEPTSLVPSMRRVLRELDPELPMYAVGTTGEVLRESLAERRVFSFVIAGFAGMALLLALGGIYGVLSYLVGQRGHEIGIRMAMGATRRDVLGLVVRDGLRLAGAGTLLGFAAAFGLTLLAGNALADMLVGQSPRDPATFVGAAALLTVTALLATLAPAARAVSVQPQTALREE